MVHCLPALDAITELWPDASIDWVTESLSASLLEGHPALRDVFVLPRKQWSKRLRAIAEWPELWDEVRRFSNEFRRRSYDLVIDFQGNLRSRVVTIGARGRRRITHHRSEVKEHRWLVPGPGPETPSGHVHRVEKNLHLVRSLGWSGSIPRGRLPDLSPEASRLAEQLDVVVDARPRVVLQPFVSAFGRFKEWPRERYSALARELAKDGIRTIVTWAPNEYEAAESIVGGAEGAAELAPPTRSVRELAALLSLANLIVGSDTGPVHLGSVLDVPVVGLYGPKDPVVYRPWSAASHTLHATLNATVPCAPCLLRKCAHAICMQTIAVADVAAAVRGKLDEAASRAG